MNISTRVYGLLLFAYPAEFRRKFGDQMLQVFRDCYRAEARSGSVPSFWLRTLVDLVFTAAKERSDKPGREGVFMNRRRNGISNRRWHHRDRFSAAQVWSEKQRSFHFRVRLCPRRAREHWSRRQLDRFRFEQNDQTESASDRAFSICGGARGFASSHRGPQ